MRRYVRQIISSGISIFVYFCYLYPLLRLLFPPLPFDQKQLRNKKKNTLPCIALHDMLHSHIHNSFAFRKEIFRVAFHFEFLFFVFVFCSITVSIITANMSIYDDHKIMNHSSIYRRINAKFLGWTMDLIG